MILFHIPTSLDLATTLKQSTSFFQGTCFHNQQDAGNAFHEIVKTSASHGFIVEAAPADVPTYGLFSFFTKRSNVSEQSKSSTPFLLFPHNSASEAKKRKSSDDKNGDILSLLRRSSGADSRASTESPLRLPGHALEGLSQSELEHVMAVLSKSNKSTSPNLSRSLDWFVRGASLLYDDEFLQRGSSALQMLPDMADITENERQHIHNVLVKAEQRTPYVIGRPLSSQRAHHAKCSQPPEAISLSSAYTGNINEKCSIENESVKVERDSEFVEKSRTELFDQHEMNNLNQRLDMVTTGDQQINNSKLEIQQEVEELELHFVGRSRSNSLDEDSVTLTSYKVSAISPTDENVLGEEVYEMERDTHAPFEKWKTSNPEEKNTSLIPSHKCDDLVEGFEHMQKLATLAERESTSHHSIQINSVDATVSSSEQNNRLFMLSPAYITPSITNSSSNNHNACKEDGNEVYTKKSNNAEVTQNAEEVSACSIVEYDIPSKFTNGELSSQTTKYSQTLVPEETSSPLIANDLYHSCTITEDKIQDKSEKLNLTNSNGFAIGMDLTQQQMNHISQTTIRAIEGEAYERSCTSPTVESENCRQSSTLPQYSDAEGMFNLTIDDLHHFNTISQIEVQDKSENLEPSNSNGAAIVVDVAQEVGAKSSHHEKERVQELYAKCAVFLCLVTSVESIAFEAAGGEGSAAVYGIDCQPTSSGCGHMLDSARRGRFGFSDLGRFATGAIGKAKQAVAEITQNAPSTIDFTMGNGIG
ncbi:hypothetical protein DICVIV_03822 [Dictyocaulus viviparus]|uniref:Uncharacterized protein n=1 Tax=Dictyocaulus viviparus TaxID=29172 RepID=A0A0D8Y618_DICVI|nr:hypothetical protein DICVIV_03822 [Dictyocaulus viviparus]